MFSLDLVESRKTQYIILRLRQIMGTQGAKPPISPGDSVKNEGLFNLENGFGVSIMTQFFSQLSYPDSRHKLLVLCRTKDHSVFP